MRGATLILIAAISTTGAAFGKPVQRDSVQIWTTLSAPVVPLGGTTILELHVETSGAAPQRIVLPDLPPEIEVVGTREYSQIRFSFGGSGARLVRRELVLRPKATGTFRIPPFSVTVDGRTYRTGAITLTVSPAAPGTTPGAVPWTAPGAAGGGGPSGGIGGGGAPGAGTALGAPDVLEGHIARGPDDEVLFVVSLTPDTVYVGQQVTLRADVLVSERAQFRLRRSPEYVPPDAPGFWTHDLPGAPASRPVAIGGHVYLGRSVSRAYFPIAAGVHVLEPARLTYDIRRGVLYSPQSHELRSDSLRVVVLPLPDAGRPATFTGAVGRFEVRARLEPDDVPAGEATALIVEVEGDGHIKTLPPPVLPALDGVQVYPPSEHADVRSDGGVVTGTKRFTWVLVPGSPGRVELPPIEYAYFDPARREYVVARSAPLNLTVRPGAAPTEPPAPTAAIRPLKTEPAGAPRFRWVRSPWFGATLLLPFAGLLGGLAARRRNIARPGFTARRDLRRRLERDIESLRMHAGGDPSALLRDLDRLIRTWLAERMADSSLLRVEPRALAAALESRGVGVETAAAIAGLLERIARARFEPVPTKSGDRLGMIAEAERLLRRVDAEARSSRPTRVGAVLAVLCLASGPGTALAQGAGSFAQGVASFQEGRYEEAAEAFSAFVAAEPEDQAGWYNLGVAYYAAGERGRAVWAWLHAARLAPRDVATRHNLRVAGVEPGLVRAVLPPVPLSADELILVAGVSWLIGGGAAAALVWRRRRALTILALLGLGVAVASGGAWTADRIGREVGITLPPMAYLRAAPHLHAEALRTLDAASAVEIVEARDEWLLVRVGGGAEGWIEARDVGRFYRRRAYGAPPAL